MFGYGNNFPYSNSSSIKQVNRSKTCKLDLKTNNILIKTNKTGNDAVERNPRETEIKNDNKGRRFKM